MHISEFGPTSFNAENLAAHQAGDICAMWFMGGGFSESVVVCINNRILPKTTISEDGDLITAVLSNDMLFFEQRLFIFLLDTRTDERSNTVVVPVLLHERGDVFLPEPTSILPPKGKKLLISCFPKSGSTFLLKNLCKVTGIKSWPMVYEYGGNEQDLYLPSIIDAYSLDTITQQHVRATSSNLKIIKNYGFQVVVLIRNIFDTLISLHDHLLSESFEIPMVFIDESFRDLEFEKRMDLLVNVATPWYLNFYASWLKVDSTHEVDGLLWVSYDELMTDKYKTLSHVLASCELATNLNMFDSFPDVNNEDTRLNVGVSGRGRQLLSESQVSRILEMSQCYPDVDLSSILK